MMKLLITDDSGFMRELLTDILADAEHQIETAETGELLPLYGMPFFPYRL